MDGDLQRFFASLHDITEEEAAHTGKIAGKDMLGNIDSGKVGSGVECCSDDTGKTDEYIEHRLNRIRHFRDERFSAEKLEHIPKVCENDGKSSLNKFGGVAVKHAPDAPDEKGGTADPPGDVVAFRQSGNTIEFFHRIIPGGGTGLYRTPESFPLFCYG